MKTRDEMNTMIDETGVAELGFRESKDGPLIGPFAIFRVSEAGRRPTLKFRQGAATQAYWLDQGHFLACLIMAGVTREAFLREWDALHREENAQ